MTSRPEVDLALVASTIALALAMLGYFTALRRWGRLAFAFVPAVTFSGFGLIVFVGGLVGQLLPSVWFAVGLGLLALVLSLRHPGDIVRTLLEPAMLLLVGLTAALIIYLRGQEFLHYDNFSHWALVVKVMLTENAFPTTADPLVTFTDYPLGSASFAYAVGRATGAAEWHLMLGQALLLVSYLTCVLGFVRRWAVVAAAAVIGLLVSFAAYGIALNSLLVDGLLGAQVAAIALVAIRHRRRPGPPLPALAVLLAFLGVTKSSGLLFVLLLTVLIAGCIRASGGRLRWGFAAMAATPWIVELAWNRHVATTFPKGLESKHALSISYLRDMLAKKTASERTEIVTRYRAEALDDRVLLALAVVAALLLIALVVSRAISIRTAVLGWVGTALVVLIYHGANLAMYLTSMPLTEALRLAGYRRYLGTVHLALLVLVVAAALALMSRLKTPAALVAGLVAIALPLGFFLDTGDTMLLRIPNLADTTRGQLDEALARTTIPNEDEACVVVDQKDGGYAAHILSYLLLSPDVQGFVVSPGASEKKRIQTVLTKCDAIAILKPNPPLEAALTAVGWRVDGSAPTVALRTAAGTTP